MLDFQSVTRSTDQREDFCFSGCGERFSLYSLKSLFLFLYQGLSWYLCKPALELLRETFNSFNQHIHVKPGHLASVQSKPKSMRSTSIYGNCWSKLSQRPWNKSLNGLFFLCNPQKRIEGWPLNESVNWKSRFTKRIRHHRKHPKVGWTQNRPS